MRRLLRAPALHFVVIGALLFALSPSPQITGSVPSAAREPIVITAARRAQIRDLYTRETGLPLTPEDEKALLEREVREELLYREALAHGLQLHDRSVQWRLVSKMRFLSADEAEAADEEAGDPAELYRQAVELGLDRDDVIIRRILVHKIRLLIRLQADDDTPDDATLRAYFRDNAQEFLQPSRVSFQHVFASRQKRGARAEADMHELLAGLESGAIAPADVERAGDPFALGDAYRSRSHAGVAKIFGDDFAEAVLSAPPGRWSGPYESAYGWHLVRVDSREGEHLPEFEAVRSRILQRYVDEKRTAYLEKTLDTLRDQYEVVIEDVAAGGENS